VVLDEGLRRLGQDPGPARHLRLHLDVVPGRFPFHLEVDPAAGHACRRAQAGRKPGVLPSHDAVDRIVLDRRRLIRGGREAPQDVPAEKEEKPSPSTEMHISCYQQRAAQSTLPEVVSCGPSLSWVRSGSSVADNRIHGVQE
jgi:hypothetical protein